LSNDFSTIDLHKVDNITPAQSKSTKSEIICNICLALFKNEKALRLHNYKVHDISKATNTNAINNITNEPSANISNTCEKVSVSPLSASSDRKMAFEKLSSNSKEQCEHCKNWYVSLANHKKCKKRKINDIGKLSQPSNSLVNVLHNLSDLHISGSF
jgi:hypothetical protein